MEKNKLLVGTSKGLVVFEKGLSGWQVIRTLFVGFPVSMVFVDERTGTWWIGLAHRHWGQKLQRSNDEGISWEEVSAPRYPEDAVLKSGKLATLRKVWCMAAAGEDQPGVLYLGTEPGGLLAPVGITPLSILS